MRILTTEQNTDEWETARRGRVTASNVSKAFAGKNTKGRLQYIETLVLDLEGVDDFGDTAPWFVAGRKYESYALGWYQMEMGIDVETTGFILHPIYNWFGCSPDGLVGDKGMVEIKFRTTLETFHESNIKPISRMYEYQMQAQMECCDREWCDYMNYWRDPAGREQGHIRRIERDEGKIRELENAAMILWRDTVRAFKARNNDAEIIYPWDMPRKERQAS